jgi:hypothetical protein
MVRLGFSCPQVNMPCFLLRLGDLMGWPCVFFSRLLLLVWLDLEQRFKYIAFGGWRC